MNSEGTHTPRLALFDVIQPGRLTLVQDGGREQHEAWGITESGPCDPYAAYWANLLCGNSPDTPLLECTLGGLVLKTLRQCSIAVAGAPLLLRLNGQIVPLWQTLCLQVGDIVSLGMPKNGLRTYLAVTGGLAAPQVFGSCATSVRDKLGGLQANGSPITSADRLFQAVDLSVLDTIYRIDKRAMPVYPDRLHLRFICGYQWPHLGPLVQQAFCQQEYSVSPDSDRMGVRLKGTAISGVQGIVSEGITLGAIQLPPDGQPIVMLNDRQTIGGYAKLGSVLEQDCALLAQARPGCRIQFHPVSLSQAAELRHHLAAFFQHTPLIEVSAHV